MIVIGGCSSSVRVTDPARSATEQFLLSGAAAEAVSQLALEPLRGRKVFLDTQYFVVSDQPFVIGELRFRMLTNGVQLVNEKSAAQIVVEMRSGGIGVDRSDFFVGVPPLLLEGSVGSNDNYIPLSTPELSLIKNIDQRGIASVAYVAYWRDTGEVVAASGPFYGFTRREDWWYFGFGRGTVGNIAPADIPPD